MSLSPRLNALQGDQVAGTGESLPVSSQTSGPMEGAALTENKASGDQGARAGESLPAQSQNVDSQPVSSDNGTL